MSLGQMSDNISSIMYDKAAYTECIKNILVSMEDKNSYQNQNNKKSFL